MTQEYAECDCVILKDYEVVACHGVNPEEKINPQRFLFSIEVVCDFSLAAQNDDIAQTISYSAVKKYIKCFCEQNCFDLIETLAVRIAEGILVEFELAKAVTLTVKKPDAPMSGKFEYAGVRVKRAWHTVYLALGSNEGDKNGYLDFAIEKLKSNPLIKFVRESNRMISEPYGGIAQGEFVNSALECMTVLAPKQLLAFINEIESQGGRVRKEHWGNRTLDIDIIFYDNLISGDKELSLPHIDMQHRLFVLQPLTELCPEYIHPLLRKRVSELYYELTTQTK